jgi:hypothetical protein
LQLHQQLRLPRCGGFGLRPSRRRLLPPLHLAQGLRAGGRAGLLPGVGGAQLLRPLWRSAPRGRRAVRHLLAAIGLPERGLRLHRPLQHRRRLHPERRPRVLLWSGWGCLRQHHRQLHLPGG